LGLANKPAEDSEDGFNQFEIERKKIMKILDIELESVNRFDSFYIMDRRTKI
jgi:hypothetical protein